MEGNHGISPDRPDPVEENPISEDEIEAIDQAIADLDGLDPADTADPASAITDRLGALLDAEDDRR